MAKSSKNLKDKQTLPRDISCLMPVVVRIDGNGNVEHYVTQNLDGTGDKYKAVDSTSRTLLLEKKLAKAMEMWKELFVHSAHQDTWNAYVSGIDLEKAALERWNKAMSEVELGTK